MAKARWAFTTPNAEKACLFRKRSLTKRKERFFKTPFLLMPKETGFFIPKENHKGEIPFDPPAYLHRLFRMRSLGTADRSAIERYCHSGLFLLVTKREHRPDMTAVRPTFRRKRRCIVLGGRNGDESTHIQPPSRGSRVRPANHPVNGSPPARTAQRAVEGVFRALMFGFTLNSFSQKPLRVFCQLPQ